jgi:hypothetical protein
VASSRVSKAITNFPTASGLGAFEKELMESHTIQTPEFIRPGDVPKYFSISRASVYQLITAGLVKSKSLKRPGNIRGIRLISTESLRAYIEAQPAN